MINTNDIDYRQMQEVQLDKHIRLLDSPGVVMATGTSDTSIILKNCVRVSLNHVILCYETVHDFLLKINSPQS